MPLARMPSRARRRVRKVHASVAVAVAALLLSACSAAVSQTAPSPLPDGVDVGFVQLRSDVAARQAQVEVRNGTGTPIEIGDVTVTDPRFADAATRLLDRTTVLAPGDTVDIRIQLPKMACSAADGSSTVQLELLGGESPGVRQASLPDELDVIAGLHERECRAEALAHAAAVSIVSFSPSSAGSPADLVLEIAPTGRAGGRIIDVQDTNLLTFAGTQPVGFAIAVDVAQGDIATKTLHLPLVPLRCDPHAVQEDKRGTVFTLDVELDGRPGTVELAASEEMRGHILTWVADWCGFGAP
jgi:hypothetical protein